MKIFANSFVAVVMLGFASATEAQRTETAIAKGYGRVSLALPDEWTVVRDDQGWETTNSTFYRVSKPAPEKRTADDDQWTSGFLLCFEKEIAAPDLKARKFRPLVGEPKYGTIDSGLKFCRVERLGPLPGNGPAVIDQRNITYHFSGLPYAFAITISGPKDFVMGEALHQLETILKTVIVDPGTR